MASEQDPNQNKTPNSAAQNNSSTPSTPPPKILSLSIKDLTVLYTAYMSFVAHGGLFIPTKKAFNMGDMLPLLISLSDDSKYQVDGKVIWITPDTSSSNRTAGIGVQFTGPLADELSKKIQNLLVTTIKNSDPTNTM